MNTQIKIIVLTTFTILTFGCNKDDDNNTQPLKAEKQILSFVFNADENEALTENITATIDENNKTITALIPYGTNISSLAPNIQVSAKANVNPNGFQDFSIPITYTVTAEDGSKAIYEVILNIEEASSEKQITSFVFNTNDNNVLNNDLIASINEDTKTILLTISNDVDLTALIPTVEISSGASINPTGIQDFSSPITYTVTAQDQTTAAYEAKIYSQRDILINLYNINPNNTLDWDLTDMDINNWRGVTTGDNGNIIELILDFKKIDVIPSEIGLLTNLTNLNLRDNNLTDIPNEIWQLINLTTLQLGRNNISHISDQIGLLTNLISLSIAENKLPAIPDAVWKLTNLNQLLIGSNNLTYISNEIGRLTNLTTLSIGNNNLNEIPNEIGQLTNLTYLHASNNNLTSIPNEIVNLTNLTGLILENNSLTIIPDEIWELTNLESLYLSNNNLTSIPNEIGVLTNLTRLNLGGNGLTSIPSLFGKLTDLTTLSLKDNELTSIPVQIGELINLTTLSLENNNLTTIPQEVCDLNIANLTIDDGVICE